MIDAVDLAFLEMLVQPAIELARRRKIGAERLLDDDAAPSAVDLTHEARFAEMVRDRTERGRRGREIEQSVAVGAECAGGRVHCARQAGIGRGIVEITAQVRKPPQQIVDDLLIDRRGGELAQRVVHARAERVIRHLAAGDADDGKAVRQQPRDGEIIERWHQQTFGQVAGRAEDHEGARIGLTRRRLRGTHPRWRRNVHHVRSFFGSTCPPNPLRIAESTRSEKLASSRERNRA